MLCECGVCVCVCVCVFVKLEVLCIQETVWKGNRPRTLAGGYQMLHA